jgi:hypothetical protein
VKRVDQRRVVPPLDVVVRPVVDLDFDGVPVVVDEEDDRVGAVADHGRHVLCGDLRSSRHCHRLASFQVQKSSAKLRKSLNKKSILSMRRTIGSVP